MFCVRYNLNIVYRASFQWKVNIILETNYILHEDTLLTNLVKRFYILHADAFVYQVLDFTLC